MFRTGLILFIVFDVCIMVVASVVGFHRVNALEVILTEPVAVPMLNVSPSSLSFQGFQGGANVGGTLNIRNAGDSTLSWGVSVDKPWVSVSPTSGSSTGETDAVTVYTNIASLPLGRHEAMIRVEAVGSASQTVPVMLEVRPGFAAENIEYVGRILGGSPFNVAVQGNRAYLATGFGLVILDISNPARPMPLGQTLLNGTAEDVAVLDNLAYVAAGEAGLRIIDVSNPVQPLERGSFDTPGFAFGVAVSGNVVYVADASAGLRLIDVSNPAQPVERGLFDTPGVAFNVAVVGSLA
jgi:hypothetical protein